VSYAIAAYVVTAITLGVYFWNLSREGKRLRDELGEK